MKDNDIKRISRLTAIVMQLQTKRLLTASELSQQFGVSTRTIYRDLKTLQEAGVPILVEDGKGYFLMEGYKIPPMMFTETEANALITAEQLILKSKDSSIIKAYTDAINKIKAVLQYDTKDKVELLSNRIAIKPSLQQTPTTDTLSAIQQALTSLKTLKIIYHSKHKDELTERIIEPFALYYDLQDSWILIAYCLLRKDYRMFHLIRILNIQSLDSSFKPHKLTLEGFISHKNNFFDTLDTPLS